MKIIVDAMGGDHAPESPVKGVFEAVGAFENVEIILVGDKSKIDAVMQENNLVSDRVEIVHTAKAMTMDDDPASILRDNKDSSMGIAFKILAEGGGDALVTAGNSGAMLTGATLVVKRIHGIKRPALGVVLPYVNKTLLIDAGANVDAKAECMSRFGLMGSIYMNKLFGIANPTVGLANNGAEKSKGTPEHVKAYKLLSETDTINFTGNIEGRDITMHSTDVLVTDGFTGNMILKLTEGFGLFMSKTFKDIFYKNTASKVSGFLVKGSLQDLKASFDQSEYGGAPLLGVKKPVLKAHGSSDARAIRNAVRQAKNCVETKLIEEIENRI